MTTKILTHPVQTYRVKPGGELPVSVTTAAYEVYCELYGEQKAMVEGGCRGGFGVGELIAFLYARAFPREQWRARFDETFEGMKNL